MTQFFNNYWRAIMADMYFDDCIRAQYGPKATRWNHGPEPYNEQTQHAFDAKLKADNAWRDDVNLTK